MMVGLWESCQFFDLIFRESDRNGKEEVKKKKWKIINFKIKNASTKCLEDQIRLF